MPWSRGSSEHQHPFSPKYWDTALQEVMVWSWANEENTTFSAVKRASGSSWVSAKLVRELGAESISSRGAGFHEIVDGVILAAQGSTILQFYTPNDPSDSGSVFLWLRTKYHQTRLTFLLFKVWPSKPPQMAMDVKLVLRSVGYLLMPLPLLKPCSKSKQCQEHPITPKACFRNIYQHLRRMSYLSQILAHRTRATNKVLSTFVAMEFIKAPLKQSLEFCLRGTHHHPP